MTLLFKKNLKRYSEISIYSLLTRTLYSTLTEYYDDEEKKEKGSFFYCSFLKSSSNEGISNLWFPGAAVAYYLFYLYIYYKL